MPARPSHARAVIGARPLLAVATVGGFLAALLATGHPAAATARPAAAAAQPAPIASRLWTPALSQPASATAAKTQRTEHAPARRTTEHASRSKSRKPLHRWVRPNYGPITSPFGMRWGRMHEGVDLGGAYGSAIKAATDGCIEYAGPMEGYGEVIKIRDWDGTETVYGHMSSFVRRQGCVKAGQVIARVGSAGDATGPHLHFEVRIHGTPVNPVPFMARRGVHL